MFKDIILDPTHTFQKLPLVELASGKWENGIQRQRGPAQKVSPVVC